MEPGKKAELSEITPNEAGPEPGMEIFKILVLMMRRRSRGRMVRLWKGFCSTVVDPRQMDDLACELADVGEMSLLTSRSGQRSPK